jgi:hypothetical protein
LTTITLIASYDDGFKIEDDIACSEYCVIPHLHNELNEFPEAGNYSHFPILLLRSFKANMIERL